MPIGLRIGVVQPTILLEKTFSPSAVAMTMSIPTPVLDIVLAPSPLVLDTQLPTFTRDLGGSDVVTTTPAFVYETAKKKFATGEIDWDTDDIRCLLVMTNTTADTETDKEFISQFTTLDEFNGAGYARQTMAGEAVNQDTPNARAELDATDEAFAALSNGTRQIQGVVFFKFVTNDADSIPIAYTAFTAFNPGGSVLTLEFNAEGIIWLT